MKNAQIRSLAWQRVKANFWKIIGMTFVFHLVTSLVLYLLSALLNIPALDPAEIYLTSDAYFQQELVNGLPGILTSSWLSSLLTTLLTVGWTYWMALKLADTGQFDVGEWLSTYSRQPGRAIGNVLLYDIAISLLSGLSVLPVLWISAYIVIGLGTETWPGDGMSPVVVVTLLILASFLSLLVTAYVQFKFTFPNYIVYDLMGVSFGEVWSINRILTRGRFAKAFRLMAWYILVFIGVTLGYGLLVFLLASLLAMLQVEVLLGIATILFVVIGVVAFVLLAIPFLYTMYTAWALFYREAIQDCQQELESNFPHIDFSPLLQSQLLKDPQLSNREGDIRNASDHFSQ